MTLEKYSIVMYVTRIYSKLQKQFLLCGICVYVCVGVSCLQVEITAK